MRLNIDITKKFFYIELLPKKLKTKQMYYTYLIDKHADAREQITALSPWLACMEINKRAWCMEENNHPLESVIHLYVKE